MIQSVFHADVPETLLRLLPANLKPLPDKQAVNKLYIRCIVRSFTDNTIIADTDEGEITIDYGDHDDGVDLTYLRKILREGMQLNLLDCTIKQASTTVHAKLIVVEPDFLIDISALAVCFTAYGHHPLIYTINRMKPKPNTQATLLGNFAGTALDDIINNPQTTTQQSLQRSYREQAERFMACDDFCQENFEQEAERQMQNIRQAIDIMKPQRALLEPSFICEKLGLQGRVDLMTADMSLLVEQKSGKNMKIEHHSHDPHGLQREDHYVQLLLYYGTLRYNFRRSDTQVDTRLLYSHYEPKEGLLSVNYYRALFREAIKLRNQIVATELLIARDGFSRIIPLLDTDIIYKGVARDAFFARFIMPEMEKIQRLYASLSELERTYYERMVTFVYREQRAQKLGTSQQTLHHSGGCNSDLWLLPLSEKLEQGNIIKDLSIDTQQRKDDDSGYNIITLTQTADAEQPSYNFREGDMVCLYCYTDEPDVRKSILYKGTLKSISHETFVVELNNGQQNPDIFKPENRQLWAIEHASSDVGTASCLRSLNQFIKSDKTKKDLLLGQRPPLADTSATLSQSYNPHYDDILLKIRQARDYFLLVGPPGTGKTSMALRYIVEEELHQLTAKKSESKILLMAYTNRAVDEIRSMLKESSLDSDERIITGTTSMMLARPFLIHGQHFELVVVDEASQVLEPGLIGLLADSSIERFVLIGDHKQLPAVVQQNADDAIVDNDMLRNIGLNDCRQSLFQRLYNWEKTQGRTQFIGTLCRQGRMHPDAALFANRHFYENSLKPVPIAHQREQALNYPLPSIDHLDDLLKSHRLLFLPVVPTTQYESAKANMAEAKVVADVVSRILRFYGTDKFNPQKTLGIIVPYRNQISAIRQALSDLKPAWLDDVNKLSALAESISIDTVERFQGSQRDVIIYSFTVSRLYQLDFLTASTFTDNEGQLIDRKLNVALTRARHQTIMVGNPVILSQWSLFGQLIKETEHSE